MDVSVKIKNRWGYLIAFLMLLISYMLIFVIISKLDKEAGRVSHSYDVLNNLESIKAEITDAETGVRGYAITKDVRYLKPYNTGSKRVLILFKDLQRLTLGNELYQPRVDSLGLFIHRRLSDLSNFLTQFQRNGFVVSEEILANREANKKVMDNIRLLVEQLKLDEQVLMAKRNSKLENFFTSTTVIAVISLIVALVTIIYSLFNYGQESRARQEADNNARSYAIELEQRVNELARVNRELEELRSIEKFAATGRIARTIAHEVRNPLTNISLAAEQLKENTPSNAESDVLLQMIGRNVTRINQLVADLLNSTRFEELSFEPVNINDLMDEVITLARDRIDLNHILVHKEYDSGLCEIRVDREKIKLAFLNIVVNAIEAMDAHSGVLQIRTMKEGDKCIIDIQDNGMGMDDETLNKLFEPYFTGKLKGNGLGLTNTQNIILNHKGSINVKSAKNQGSTFTILLNLHEG